MPDTPNLADVLKDKIPEYLIISELLVFPGKSRDAGDGKGLRHD